MKKLLSLIIILIQFASLAYGAELTSYTKQKFLGINPRVNLKLLSDDEAKEASNITLEETGAFKDRETFGQYNNYSGVLGSNFVSGLFKYYTSSAKYFIGCAGSNVASGSGGAFAINITPTTNTVTSGSYWSAVTFADREYLFNPSVPMMMWDGSMSRIYPPVSVPTDNCAYSAVHKNRGWAARPDAIKYRIYFSSIYNPTSAPYPLEDWTTTGGYIDLPDTSQEITGIISWGGFLYVFTETSIYVLLGSTPNDFSLRKSNSMVGAIAPRTIDISEIGIILLSRTGLYSFDGNSSHKLSDKVEPLINDISKTNIRNACGMYDGQGKYWLSYTHKNSSYNNKILIYDITLKEWYPYNNLNISVFERAYGGSDKGELYGGSSTTNGIVYLLQESSGTESITHSTNSDFVTQVTENTVVTTRPSVDLQNGFDSYTKLLSHFNGVDGAVAYKAETGQSLAFFGTAQLDNAQTKFGVTSLITDLVTGYVTVPDNSDWDFGTDFFTIDLWVKFSSIHNYNAIVAHHQDANNEWQLKYDNVAGKLVFYSYTGGVIDVQVSTTWAPLLNTWYHIAVIRKAFNNDSGDWLLAINGIVYTPSLDFGAWNGTVGNFTSHLQIGYSGAGVTDGFTGWIDEIRISNGARWTTDFNIPIREYGQALSNGTLISQPIQINAASAAELDTINWLADEDTNTKITFQTRTGATSDTVYFNGWQYWSSDNTITLNTVTDGTAQFTSSTNLKSFEIKKPYPAISRNVLYYEDEDVISANCVSINTIGAVSKGHYIEAWISNTNLSVFNWLSGWWKTDLTGNSVEFYFGESTSSSNYVTFNTVSNSTIDGWHKWYWYIGDIPASERNNVNYIKYRFVGDGIGSVAFGEVTAHNFYDSEDTMTSTPNDWIQYRAIFGSNDYTKTPQLLSTTLNYTPVSGNLESSIESYYHTKWIDFSSPQINKQFIDFYTDVFTDENSSLEPFYFDYDIDNGAKTGTITIPSTSTVTDNTIKIKRYFPSSTYGKTMQLKYRNPDAKTSKHTIQGVEVRMRAEPLGN